MPSFTRFYKYALGGLGAVGSAYFVYYNMYGHPEQVQVCNWTSLEYSRKWDNNWDRRDPKSLMKPMQVRNEEDENRYNKQLAAYKPKAVKHYFLIRHGQYNRDGKRDSERGLTPLGRLQAEATGKRLAELGVPYTLIVKSTMTRAQETSKIIEQSLATVNVEHDNLLTEGNPYPLDPLSGVWRTERSYFVDGPRIEAAFRRYLHRADPSQKQDSYTVLVCHANVIRYFVCRALQLPPEAWIRISLKHGSITMLSIYPNGKVTLHFLGDCGHMEPKLLTT
ncbi:serine/threonine-protein phosphatase PGAM5, mitochondrial isoform X2 [Orussus abietinus]|nr:serine/threonine-protein phosphatase PGAM5, mitochondrial isoform X2 [Orussus abietinus]